MANEEPIYISIHSNSRILSDGLVSLLTLHLNIQVIGVSDPQQPSAPNPARHLMLLDSSLGRERLIALTQQYCKAHPPLPTIILEVSEDIDLIMACIEAGASGYTLRGACVDEVIRVIVGTLHGVAYCDPAITARLFQRVFNLRQQSGVPAKLPLTSRELEVLNYIARGLSNLEIAAKLNIEVRTVKHHVHNILEKLNLRRRWEAVRLATERGWIESHAPLREKVAFQ